MRKQKGQSLVEFTLVLPFFFLLIFGLIYSGMLFHDYSTLSNIARSAAREAAVSSESNYTEIRDHYSVQSTITTLYTCESFTVAPNDTGEYVQATIHMARTVKSPVMDIVLPLSFDIVYYMKKDTPASSGGN